MAEIEATGLVKRFGRRSALGGVDLVIEPGELCGVVGEDGAGKTTLLRLVAGLYRPDEGRVQLAHGRASLGLAPQGFHLYEDLTVEENLAFFAALHGMAGRTLASRSTELLAFTGLEHLRARRAGALSGGMRQRLTLACSIVHLPAVVLLDEPTTGLDPVARRDLWTLVEHLHADGTTILVATADFDEASRCETAVFLHAGRVLARGGLEDVQGSLPTLEAAFLAAMRR
ncbi:MAG TPA: ABC transporter ATP-binding protein [Acidimicrobiales bacterium]|nr:ABC transporter ATP-binding protein [Acidimicrobiales bacterium]